MIKAEREGPRAHDLRGGLGPPAGRSGDAILLIPPATHSYAEPLEEDETKEDGADGVQEFPLFSEHAWKRGQPGLTRGAERRENFMCLRIICGRELGPGDTPA